MNDSRTSIIEWLKLSKEEFIQISKEFDAIIINEHTTINYDEITKYLSTDKYTVDEIATNSFMIGLIVYKKYNNYISIEDIVSLYSSSAETFNTITDEITEVLNKDVQLLESGEIDTLMGVAQLTNHMFTIKDTLDTNEYILYMFLLGTIIACGPFGLTEFKETDIIKDAALRENILKSLKDTIEIQYIPILVITCEKTYEKIGTDKVVCYAIDEILQEVGTDINVLTDHVVKFTIIMQSYFIRNNLLQPNDLRDDIKLGMLLKVDLIKSFNISDYILFLNQAIKNKTITDLEALCDIVLNKNLSNREKAYSIFILTLYNKYGERFEKNANYETV